MSNGEATDGTVRPMASLLTGRASAGVILIAGLVAMVGFVPLSAGLIAAFMAGHLTTALVSVGGTMRRRTSAAENCAGRDCCSG